jgi:hypothetical protein
MRENDSVINLCFCLSVCQPGSESMKEREQVSATFRLCECPHGIVVVLHRASLLPGHHALGDATVQRLALNFLFSHFTKHPLREAGGEREGGMGKGDDESKITGRL